MKAAVIVSLIAALSIAMIVTYFCLNPQSTKFAQREGTEKPALVDESHSDENIKNSDKIGELSEDIVLDDSSGSEQTIDNPKMLEVAENLFWEDIAMNEETAGSLMPPTNYTDFNWIPVPGEYKDYLAAKINVIRQEIVAEGKVQVYLVGENGDVETVSFKVPRAERMVNLLWHGTLERMAIGAALAFEFPKFRLLENGYEINGHVSKVVRYTTEPTQNDDHDRMLDEFKQLLTSSWATGIDIESAMIEDEYKIPTAAQPFQSLASGRTKSFGCGMVTCKDNINGQIEYIRVYACIFNGRMTIKDEYDTKRPLYMYDGFNASQKGVDHIETDHIPIADSNLHSFINGRQTN